MGFSYCEKIYPLFRGRKMPIIPRWRWKDIRNGQTFEIVIDRMIDARTTYFQRFIVLNAFFDVGIENPEYRKCEISLPLKEFMRAFQELNSEDKLKFRLGKMKIKLLKLRYSKMKILEIGEV